MEVKIIDASSAKGKAKSIEERIAFLETQSSPECKPSKSSEACSAKGNEERIDILPHSLPECKPSNSTIQVEVTVGWRCMLALGLVLGLAGGLTVVSVVLVSEKLNGSKDVDAKDELPIAPRLPQQSVIGSDNEVPHSSTSMPPIRNTTTTATTTTTTTSAPTTTTTTATPTPITTTTTATPTPVTTTATPTANNDLDWKTNCGVQPLNHAGSFGVWPWQVLVTGWNRSRVIESKHLGRKKWMIQNKCEGVLLNSKFVLTVALCQSEFTTSFWVGMGDYQVIKNNVPKSEVMLPVKNVSVHPNYDLALMELRNPVTFQEHILPICFPPEKVESKYVGGVATVAGRRSLRHGDSLTERLQDVQLQIITNSGCQAWFQEENITKNITSELMCAAYWNFNSCEGDSGGPLTLRGPDGRWVLVGTVMDGIKCAKPNLPGVYMRTSHYRPWIDRIINAEDVAL